LSGQRRACRAAGQARHRPRRPADPLPVAAGARHAVLRSGAGRHRRRHPAPHALPHPRAVTVMEPLALLQLGAGLALVAIAWLLPRHIAGARKAAMTVLLFDVAPLALGAGQLSLATGRPLFAGLIILALGAGFALADYTMRQTLREPVVFSESVELPQVFSHPHLYLPFAGPGLVLGGAAAAVSLAAALLVFEPPLWTPRPGTALAVVALVAAGAWLIGRQPWLGRAADAARRLRPSGEPFEDAAALGPFAMLQLHALIARAERP